MFYYYGRKKQIARHYPEPAYDTIVEPFAGAAAYALYGDRWQREVLLIERDPRVAEIWQWLVETAMPDAIRALPELKVGEKSSEFLHIIHAVTKMAFKYKTIKVTPVLERNWEISKRVMAANLHKVKHWRIVCGDYTEAPDIDATWFIDPPYKSHPGTGYDYGSGTLDYKPSERAAIQLFAGAQRGGLKCVSGVCRLFPPFEGLKLQVTLRY